MEQTRWGDSGGWDTRLAGRGYKSTAEIPRRQDDTGNKGLSATTERIVPCLCSIVATASHARLRSGLTMDITDVRCATGLADVFDRPKCDMMGSFYHVLYPDACQLPLTTFRRQR